MTAGRLVPEKQFPKLVQAFGQIADQVPDWRLRICGEGGQRNEIIRQIRQSDLWDRVELPGAVPDMMTEWPRASVVALTSNAEGYPLVLQEAMAAGVPAVSFDSPSGPREIIEHEVNGLLVGTPVDRRHGRGTAPGRHRHRPAPTPRSRGRAHQPRLGLRHPGRALGRDLRRRACPARPPGSPGGPRHHGAAARRPRPDGGHRRHRRHSRAGTPRHPGARCVRRRRDRSHLARHARPRAPGADRDRADDGTRRVPRGAGGHRCAGVPLAPGPGRERLARAPRHRRRPRHRPARRPDLAGAPRTLAHDRRPSRPDGPGVRGRDPVLGDLPRRGAGGAAAEPVRRPDPPRGRPRSRRRSTGSPSRPCR